MNAVQSISVQLLLDGETTTLTPEKPGDGVFQITFNLTVSGLYTTSVTINGQLVSTTYSADVAPGPYVITFIVTPDYSHTP